MARKPFGYKPIGGKGMYPVKSIPVEEATGITHISKVKACAFPKTVLYGEPVPYKSGQRREDIDKL